MLKLKVSRKWTILPGELSFLYTNLEYFSSLSASMCNEIDFFEHFKIGSKYSQESP